MKFDQTQRKEGYPRIRCRNVENLRYLKASKSTQVAEPERELVAMKTAEAKEKQKAERRRARIRALRRRSFWTETVDWKLGLVARGEVVPPLRRQ